MAEIRIKEGLSKPQNGVGSSTMSNTNQAAAAIQHISNETTPDRPAMMPIGPWHTTAQLSRQQQQLLALHQHQP
jgi:hypothetical protein